MRKISFLLGAMMLFSCGTTSHQQAGKVNVSEPEAVKAAPEVNAESVSGKLAYLSSDELMGRDTGSEGIDLAADFIAGYFEEVGVKPFYPQFRDTLANYKGYAANIVGYLEGTDPGLKKEYVVVGAHYDHVGVMAPVNGDTIANGANDNASGTVAVMEIAGQLAAMEHKRSVLFALFTAEEKGLKGSAHLADRLKSAGIEVYAVVNFEMIGVPMSRDHLVYMTGYEMSTMAAHMNAVAGRELVGMLPAAKQYRLFERSDNYPFYKAFGIPAHTLSTFDFTNFDFYHRPDDEFELMDVDHMVSVIRQMVPLVTAVVNSEKGAVRMQELVPSE